MHAGDNPAPGSCITTQFPLEAQFQSSAFPCLEAPSGASRGGIILLHNILDTRHTRCSTQVLEISRNRLFGRKKAPAAGLHTTTKACIFSFQKSDFWKWVPPVGATARGKKLVFSVFKKWDFWKWVPPVGATARGKLLLNWISNQLKYFKIH